MTPDLVLGETRLILRKCEAAGLLRNQAAYVLATAFHETAHTMQPVRETLAKTDAQAIARLETAWKAGRLPWVKTPYWRKDAQGKAWFGRGFPQTTHKANYQKASDKTGIDFVGNPDLMLVPEHAATVMIRGMVEGWFTGKKLSNFITLQHSGFTLARGIINGKDRAAAIAAIARAYDKALKAAGYGEEAAPPLTADAVLALLRGRFDLPADVIAAVARVPVAA